MRGRVCILGGSGFVGHALAVRLAAAGYPLRILTRHRAANRDLLVLPDTEVVQGRVDDRDELHAAIEGCETVINLIGILNESLRGKRGAGFHHAHVEINLLAVQAARAAGARRFLHMSALGADVDGPSDYLRSKGQGETHQEKGAGAELLFATFRPSVIFGPGDSFINRFARLLRMMPLVMPLACADARFQPVYVGDVVEAFLRALQDRSTDHRTYELVGPETYSLREIVEMIAELQGTRRWIVPLPYPLAWLQARSMQFLPGKPFTPDNLRSLSVDSTSDQDGLGQLGIQATPMPAVLPRMLRGGGHREKLARYRNA